VAQSTSQTSTRPPGRKARYISASAAGTCETYSSTRTDSAASKLASSTGSEVASTSWNATLSCPSERCAATASIGWLLSMPTTEPSDPDVLRRRQLVRDALGVTPGERVLDVGCGPGFYVAELLERAIEHFELSGGALIEFQLAHPFSPPRKPR